MASVSDSDFECSEKVWKKKAEVHKWEDCALFAWEFSHDETGDTHYKPQWHRQRWVGSFNINLSLNAWNLSRELFYLHRIIHEGHNQVHILN